MASRVGQLVAFLGLDAGEYTSGLSRADVLAKRFGKNFDSAVAGGIIKAEIAIRAFGAAVKVTAQVFQSLTTGAGEFKDLEETTGASAESLAGLAVSAATAGVSMESVGGSVNKLTKNLVGVDDESQAAGAALAALGLNVKEFKTLDPAAQYEAVGKALGGFADGAGKTAIAMALFGKSGAEQLKVFKALEENGGRQTILTQRQIELADGYADAQAKAGAQLKLYAQAAATEAIPALTDLTQAAAALIKEMLGVDAETGQLAANNGVQEFAESGTQALALFVDAMQITARQVQVTGKTIAATAATTKSFLLDKPGDVIRNIKAIGDAYAEDVASVFNKPLFTSTLAQVRALRKESEQRTNLFAGQGPTKPALKFNFDAGAAAKADAEQRKLLDGRIKAIREFADQQNDAFAYANALVKGRYEDGLTSLKETFAVQESFREAALQAQVASLDKEAAVLRAARDRTKGAERIDLENKIADVVAKRAGAVTKAGRDGTLAALEETRSLKQLQERYDSLRATILQLSGDTAGASKIRIDQQVEEARKLITSQGGNPADADKYRALLTNTEALNEAQREYGRLVERSRNSEETALLAAQEGGKSELDTLRSVGASRAAALAQMGAMVDKANELAMSLGTPEAIQFAENLGLAFKRAAAEVDPLLLKMRDVGKEVATAITSPLEDVLTRTKSWREALDDVGKSLVRIAANELFTKPLQSWFSNAIGGNGQASGGGGWIGALIGAFGGGKAIGGPTMPNTLYEVGERRAETYDDGSRQLLLTGSKRGNINPNPKLGGAMRSQTVNNSFHFPGPVSSRTQTQMAAAAARSVARANARLN